MSEEIWSGNEGYLYVYVSKARDLPNLIKLDKQNVMLRLRIAHMTRESDVKFRAGQNPIFDYLEKFEITPSVKPVMYVEVYCDRKKKSPLPIGRCEVDLMNGIRADPKNGYCTWYELRRNGDEFAGTIFIELTFKPNLKRNHLKKIDKETMRLDASVAARPIPLLPTETKNISSTSVTHTNEKGIDESNFSQSNTPQYMHASEMRQVTPSIRNLHYGVDNFNGFNMSHDNVNSKDNSFSPRRNLSPCEYNRYTNQHNFETNQFGVPNFASSVDTSNTMLSQDTSNTTVTSTSAETRFHFANLKKLKERINIFKNPNISLEKNSRPDEMIGSIHTYNVNNNNNNNNNNKGVDIEALEKAIGVTSVQDDDDEDQGEKNYNEYDRNIIVNGHDSYRRPTPPIDPDHNKQSVTVDGSRRNSSRKSSSRGNEGPRLPYLPEDASLYLSSSLSPRLKMQLPPLPNEKIISKVNPSQTPQLPNLPTQSSTYRSRTSSFSPIRRPSPPAHY